MGPAPDNARTLIVIGYREADLRHWFGRVELAARIDNGVGLENDEQGHAGVGCGPATSPLA